MEELTDSVISGLALPDLTLFDGATIRFAPSIPDSLLLVLAIVALAAGLYTVLQRARGGLLRSILMGLLLLALAGPQLVAEQRRHHDDIALVVIDRSASQKIDGRDVQTDTAVGHLMEQMRGQQSLDIRIVETGTGGEGPARAPVGDASGQDGTYLVGAIQRGLEGISSERLAGIVVVTDGLAHDLPPGDPAETLSRMVEAPVHVLVTGREDERDRRLEVRSSQSYAVVGQTAETVIHVHDNGAPAGDLARVTVRIDGETAETRIVPVGRDARIEIPVSHGGRNLVEFEVRALDGELTDKNNRAALTINGVRDRLRVLLVSGEPYPGERAWRNLLKADPAVDLVHFTILRPPQKQDATPIHELALIAFPIRELFEIKLHDFDLIIFDRFWRRGVLHFSYLENIAAYVAEGGALLDAAGPAFAGPASIYRTPLRQVLPGAPTGQVTTVGFRPELTATGKRHPVTAGLQPGAHQQPWGRWFRVIDTEVTGAEVLMSGPAEKPLLVLDRVGKGRVAQLLSDHGWLWSRGLEGGGPQAEMMRRTAHWLMREPALEEESLTATVKGSTLTVIRHSLTPGGPPVTVTGPDGRQQTIELRAGEDGNDFGRLNVELAGLYRMTDGTRSTLAVLGNLNPLEFSDLQSTTERLSPLTRASGGAMIRLDRFPEPDVRQVQPGRLTAGSNWLGLVRKQAYDVTGLRTVPLAPPFLLMLVLLGLAMLVWRREGR